MIDWNEYKDWLFKNATKVFVEDSVVEVKKPIKTFDQEPKSLASTKRKSLAEQKIEPLYPVIEIPEYLFNDLVFLFESYGHATLFITISDENRKLFVENAIVKIISKEKNLLVRIFKVTIEKNFIEIIVK